MHILLAGDFINEDFFLTHMNNCAICEQINKISLVLIQRDSEVFPRRQVRKNGKTQGLWRQLSPAWSHKKDKRSLLGPQEGLREAVTAEVHVYRSALTECSFRKGRSMGRLYHCYLPLHYGTV